MEVRVSHAPCLAKSTLTTVSIPAMQVVCESPKGGQIVTLIGAPELENRSRHSIHSKKGAPEDTDGNKLG